MDLQKPDKNSEKPSEDGDLEKSGLFIIGYGLPTVFGGLLHPIFIGEFSLFLTIVMLGGFILFSVFGSYDIIKSLQSSSYRTNFIFGMALGIAYAVFIFALFFMGYL